MKLLRPRRRHRLDVFGGDINIAEGQYYRYGAGILAYAQTALHNYYFGSAGNLTTSGIGNTAVGDNSSTQLGVNAHGNTCLGASSGTNSSTGTYNTFIGSDAGYGSGGVYAGSNYNVAVGYRAGYDIAAAAMNNTLVGALAGENLTTGDNNVLLGCQAGDTLTTQSGAVAVGSAALFTTTGANNAALGYQAGYWCATGIGNTFLGYEAGFGNGGAGGYTGADYNTAVGYHAGYDLDTAALNNTLIGASAGENVTTGDGNTYLGYTSGYNSTTNTYNTFVGYESGYGSGGAYTDTHYNLAMGYRAAYSINGASGSCSYNVMLGANAGVTYGGDYLTAVGASAAQLTTGASNTALGYMAGYACRTGSANVFLGREAGRGLGGAYDGSSNNVIIGYRSGYDIQGASSNNTFVGCLSSENITTGDGNVCLGYKAGSAITTENDYLYIANSDAGAGATTLTGNFATGSIGIGMAPGSITARLHLPAGTATASTAPLKFMDGVLLATAEEGAFELDVASFWMTPISTQRQSVVGCLYAQYDSVTVANSAAETTLLHATNFRGAKSLVANFFAQTGKTLRLTLGGVYIDGANSSGTMRIQAYVGGVAVLDTGAQSIAGLLNSDLGWGMNGVITCQTTGATGHVWAQGCFCPNSTAVLGGRWDMENAATSAHIDMTAACALDVTVTFSDAAAANSITCTNVIIEALD